MSPRQLALLSTLLLLACGPRVWTGDPRPLERIIAQSEVTFNPFNSVRVLSDGRVLITDDQAAQLWVLDRDLKNARLIGDSTAATNRLYPRPGLFIRPYLGDSTMLSQAPRSYMVILDEQGRPIRNVSFAPTGAAWTNDMIGAPFTKPGDLMVLSPRRMTVRQRDSLNMETVHVVRTSFTDPRRRDTVGTYTRQLFRRDRSLPEGTSQTGWFLTGDGAAMLPDGTIGIVRTKDYHVDWIDARGKTWTTPIAHDWIVLSAEDKAEALERLRASARTFGIRIDGQVTNNVGEFRAVPTDTSVVVTKLEDIPDTVPPIPATNQVHADADGHLWIRKIAVRLKPYAVLEGQRFDVVDTRGRVVRKVMLPAAAQIKAFTKGRIYYTVPENGRRMLVVAATR
jgi:hypothetical protein